MPSKRLYFTMPKRPEQVMGAAINHLGTPSLGLLSCKNVPPNRPIEQCKLPAHRERSSQARLLNAELQILEETLITGRELKTFNFIRLALEKQEVEPSSITATSLNTQK